MLLVHSPIVVRPEDEEEGTYPVYLLLSVEAVEALWGHSEPVECEEDGAPCGVLADGSFRPFVWDEVAVCLDHAQNLD